MWYPGHEATASTTQGSEPGLLLPNEQGSHPQLPCAPTSPHRTQDPGKEGKGRAQETKIWFQIKALLEHRLSKNEGSC